MSLEDLPVAVIGAGPVALAAAARLIERGIPTRVFEAGATVGANVAAWGHVRLFSPWEFNVDPACRAILERGGWRAPPDDVYPTGAELLEAYLAPLAATPEMAAVIETDARVELVGRAGMDKVTSRGRDARAFDLRVKGSDGSTRRVLAKAVIDASGTWTNPNPLGADGLPVEGEALGGIVRGMPDVLGRDRAAHAGLATAVVGAGHSAANVLLDLAELARSEPGTTAMWVTRGTDLSRVYGGGAADALAGRGALGDRLKALVDDGRIALVGGFGVTGVGADADRLLLRSEGRVLGPVDRIVVATGQRPDLAMTRELRLDLDPWLESARALGPLIDPNQHSCGTVYPHGHRELSHPEPGFYTAGIKSYGRAPTFLMMTGYEQVRSIVAALAGDLAAADAVQLALPETGVCSTSRGDEGAAACCGTPVVEVESVGCSRPAEIAAPPVTPASACCGKAA